MIYEELKQIVFAGKQKGLPNSYIRNLLKEYLQVYVLYYIYTSSQYRQNLIFTGGTCLRLFFDLDRLSEDLDFDYQKKKFNTQRLQNDLENFFRRKYRYPEVSSALKQKGEQVLLKFPVLHQLGLAKRDESNLLYVKIDLSKNLSRHYTLETTSKSKYDFNFAAKHYDISSLMAGKINAILTRRRLKGRDDRETIKGRDYFDLLWFVKNSTKPNIKRLQDLLKEKVSLADIEAELEQRVKKLITKYKTDLQSDLMPLVRNPAVIKDYVENYYQEYSRYKSQSFSA